MDKFIRNSAIYLEIKNKKEDNYFIFQKIKKIKECCKRKDIKIKHNFLVYQNQENFDSQQYLMNQIKKYKIDLLIIEDGEFSPYIENVEIEKVRIL